MSPWLKTDLYVRKILSLSSSLPLLTKTNAPCSALSAIAEHVVSVCVNIVLRRWTLIWKVLV